MVKYSEECRAICAYCKYYKDFDRDWLKNGRFRGKGECLKKGIYVYADGYCDGFECFDIKEGE